MSDPPTTRETDEQFLERMSRTPKMSNPQTTPCPICGAKTGCYCNHKKQELESAIFFVSEIPDVSSDTPSKAWDRACSTVRKEFCSSLRKTRFELAADCLETHPLPPYEIEEML